MARRRNQPSKVDLLPATLREAVEALWRSNRYTLEQLAGFLADLAAGRRSMLPPELDLAVQVSPDAVPSRSGLGRHVKGLDALAERLQRSRTVAEALVDRLGAEPESRTARLNIELMHATIQDLFRVAEEPSEDGDGAASVVFDPEAAMLVSRALKDLAAAKKSDADLTLRLKAELAKEMREKADRALAEAEGRAKAGGGTVDFATLRAALVGAYGDA